MRHGRKRSGITPEEAPRRGTPEFRARQRESMRALRETRRRIWRCRQCPEPAKMHPETGLPMSMCEYHLEEDAKRVKAAYKKRRKHG